MTRTGGVWSVPNSFSSHDQSQQLSCCSDWNIFNVLPTGFDLEFGLRKPIDQGQGLWAILRLILLWMLQWDNFLSPHSFLLCQLVATVESLITLVLFCVLVTGINSPLGSEKLHQAGA